MNERQQLVLATAARDVTNPRGKLAHLSRQLNVSEKQREPD